MAIVYDFVSIYIYFFVFLLYCIKNYAILKWICFSVNF